MRMSKNGPYDHSAAFLSLSFMYDKMPDTLYKAEFMHLTLLRGFSKLAGKRIKNIPIRFHSARLHGAGIITSVCMKSRTIRGDEDIKPRHPVCQLSN